MEPHLNEPMDAAEAAGVKQAEKAKIVEADSQYFWVTCIIGALGLLIASGSLLACYADHFNPLLLGVAVVAALGGGAITLVRFSQFYGE